MATILKPSFALGEVSELLYHRTDTPQHLYACKKVQNALILPGGYATKRPGSRFLRGANALDEGSLLKLFRFSLDERHMIEFSDAKVLVLDEDGTLVQSFTSPYPDTILHDLKFAQLNDVLYITHPSFAIRKLTRLTAVSWAITTVTNTPSIGSASDVLFYQERLLYAATSAKPKTLFMSGTNDFTDFAVPGTLTADSAMELQITAGEDASPIFWMIWSKYLLLNVSSSLVWLSGSSGAGPVTPVSKQASVGTSLTLSPIIPLTVRDELVAVSLDRTALYAIAIQMDSNEFPVTDLTSLYPDLFANDKIKQIKFMSAPWPVIWIITDSGKLRGLTYDRAAGLSAWHTHEFGTDSPDIAAIDAMEVTETEEGSELWLVVERGPVGYTTPDSKVIERIVFINDLTPADNSGQAYEDSSAGGNGFSYEMRLTPIMPAYRDSKGDPEGDARRIEKVNVSVSNSSEFVLENPGGATTALKNFDRSKGSSFSGSTGYIALPTVVDNEGDVTIMSKSKNPVTVTAIRYQVEVD
jgi:hypothetical protein